MGYKIAEITSTSQKFNLSIPFMGYNVPGIKENNKIFYFQFPLWDTVDGIQFKLKHTHFQFPLWDTKVSFTCVDGIILLFQFPLWDTDLRFDKLPDEVYDFQFPLWDTKSTSW